MSTRVFYSSLLAREPIEELSLVRLNRPANVPESGRKMPTGAEGTVVGVLDAGATYVVEFTEPFAALLDLVAEDIAAVPGGKPCRSRCPTVGTSSILSSSGIS